MNSPAQAAVTSPKASVIMRPLRLRLSYIYFWRIPLSRYAQFALANKQFCYDCLIRAKDRLILDPIDVMQVSELI